MLDTTMQGSEVAKMEVTTHNARSESTDTSTFNCHPLDNYWCTAAVSTFCLEHYVLTSLRPVIFLSSLSWLHCINMAWQPFHSFIPTTSSKIRSSQFYQHQRYHCISEAPSSNTLRLNKNQATRIADISTATTTLHVRDNFSEFS